MAAGPTTRRGLLHPRYILLAVMVATLVAIFAAWVSPWVLPVQIAEGPMIQKLANGGATLVWYTTRPAQCELAIVVDRAERGVPVTTDGKRHIAVIDGLEPHATCEYTIRADGRELARQTFSLSRPADAAYSFLVFGDSGKATQEQYLLADQMVRQVPDFLLHTGDLIYPDGARKYYDDAFFTPYRKLLARVCFWPCIGNHDVSEPDFGQPYIDVFELPANGPADVPGERNYWFDFGNARIAVIDSTWPPADLKDKVAPWLLQVMGAQPTAGGAAPVQAATRPAARRWKFVSMHHPPYSVGPHGRGGKDAPIAEALVPAFEAAGIDIVFAGHDHLYQRTHPILAGEVVGDSERGVVYVVSGAGGARIYEAAAPGDRPAWVAAVDDRGHSFTRIAIDGGTLTGSQISVEGRQIDSWTMTKAADDVEPTEAPASAPVSP